MNRIVITLLISTLLLSCKKEQKGTSETKKPQVTMYRLDGGTIQVNNLQIFSQGDLYEGESKQFANSYYVIDHPKGTLIWDTGVSNGLAGKEPQTSPDGNFTFSRKVSIANQLRALGIAISDIDYVSFSHTHADHTGGAYAFTGATWLVQEKEYTHVKSEETQKNNPRQFNAIKKLSKIQILNGDHDVFGDGTVVIKFMPGHTPGHSALFVDLTQEGPVLLSGDLYHFNENRENKVVPSFNTSVEETKKSFEAFEAFAKEKNAKVIIQHEPKDFSQTIRGEFIFLDDAAVLKGRDFIYGVKIDEKMHELASQVENKKRDQFDMVPVIINGVINPKAKGAEGWDNVVTIKGILEIKEPTSKGSVKIESAQTSN